MLALLMDSTNVWQPGFSIPESNVYTTLEKIVKDTHGRLIIAMFASHLERLIRINTRKSEDTFGDLEAQVAGCRLAKRRFEELCNIADKYGINACFEFLPITEVKSLPAGLDVVRELAASLDPSPRSLLVVGHNPGLTDLARALLPDFALEDLPTSGTVVIDFSADRWSDIQSTRRQLVYYDFPQNPGPAPKTD